MKKTKKEKIKELEEKIEKLDAIILDAEAAEWESQIIFKKYKKLTGKDYYGD